MVSGKASGIYSDKKDVELKEVPENVSSGDSWFATLERFINDNKFMFVSVCAAILLSAIYARAVGSLGKQ